MPNDQIQPALGYYSRRGGVWVFCLLMLSYAYFYQGGGPNQYSRYALTASLAEHGSVQIDDHHELTFDKAKKDGHFFCDKPPGLSLLGCRFSSCSITSWARCSMRTNPAKHILVPVDAVNRVAAGRAGDDIVLSPRGRRPGRVLRFGSCSGLQPARH